MKLINLRRPKESLNQNISYKIFIGKNEITELKNGEEKTIEIPAEFEDEAIYAKLLWCGSKKFELRSISENETLNIKANQFLNGKSIFLGAILPLTGVLMFGFGNESQTLKMLGFGLFILLMTFTIGILTIWRHNWLNIKIED